LKKVEWAKMTFSPGGKIAVTGMGGLVLVLVLVLDGDGFGFGFGWVNWGSGKGKGVVLGGALVRVRLVKEL
jgi:hypothetical protein